MRQAKDSKTVLFITMAENREKHKRTRSREGEAGLRGRRFQVLVSRMEKSA
jgi:hypothetical protein